MWERALSDSTALVTGVGHGNGRQTALELAEHGAKVVANDSDEDIVNAIAFLAAPGNDYVNGHEFRVDGGQAPVNDLRSGR